MESDEPDEVFELAAAMLDAGCAPPKRKYEYHGEALMEHIRDRKKIKVVEGKLKAASEKLGELRARFQGFLSATRILLRSAKELLIMH